jgi:hypothetical protein
MTGSTTARARVVEVIPLLELLLVGLELDVGAEESDKVADRLSSAAAKSVAPFVNPGYCCVTFQVYLHVPLLTLVTPWSMGHQAPAFIPPSFSRLTMVK